LSYATTSSFRFTVYTGSNTSDGDLLLFCLKFGLFEFKVNKILNKKRFDVSIFLFSENGRYDNFYTTAFPTERVLLLCPSSRPETSAEKHST